MPEYLITEGMLGSGMNKPASTPRPAPPQGCGTSRRCSACAEKDAELARLREVLEQIGRIACGEDQVACDDSEGMMVIYKITKQALKGGG